MMIVKIKCHNCETESSLSLIEPNYRGPFRCWKCRSVFMIEMANSEVISWERMSEEEFDLKYKKNR